MDTLFLALARQAIISWVTLAVIPFEIMHGAIDAELERRGISS